MDLTKEFDYDMVLDYVNDAVGRKAFDVVVAAKPLFDAKSPVFNNVIHDRDWDRTDLPPEDSKVVLSDFEFRHDREVIYRGFGVNNFSYFKQFDLVTIVGANADSTMLKTCMDFVENDINFVVNPLLIYSTFRVNFNPKLGQLYSSLFCNSVQWGSKVDFTTGSTEQTRDLIIYNRHIGGIRAKRLAYLKKFGRFRPIDNEIPLLRWYYSKARPGDVALFFDELDDDFECDFPKETVVEKAIHSFQMWNLSRRNKKAFGKNDFYP